MLIEAGYDIAFDCPAQTPMLVQLNVRPSRDADLLSRDVIASDPPLAMRSYLDHFGNRVTRMRFQRPCHILQSLRHSRLWRTR
jgi:hypothetical protein